MSTAMNKSRSGVTYERTPKDFLYLEDLQTPEDVAKLIKLNNPSSYKTAAAAYGTVWKFTRNGPLSNGKPVLIHWFNESENEADEQLSSPFGIGFFPGTGSSASTYTLSIKLGDDSGSTNAETMLLNFLKSLRDYVIDYTSKNTKIFFPTKQFRSENKAGTIDDMLQQAFKYPKVGEGSEKTQDYNSNNLKFYPKLFYYESRKLDTMAQAAKVVETDQAKAVQIVNRCFNTEFTNVEEKEVIRGKDGKRRKVCSKKPIVDETFSLVLSTPMAIESIVLSVDGIFSSTTAALSWQLKVKEVFYKPKSSGATQRVTFGEASDSTDDDDEELPRKNKLSPFDD